jgi:hypothetical protein
MSLRRSVFPLVLAVLTPALTIAHAQDIPIGVTYVCNGEHIYVENCNIRDTSDTSTCMVAHPDHLTPTGFNSYTYLTRGALRKLLPTCQQPSAKELANAQAFQKKQQELYAAAVAKANPQPAAAPPRRQSDPARQHQHANHDPRAAPDESLHHLRSPALFLHRQLPPRCLQFDDLLRPPPGPTRNRSSPAPTWQACLRARATGVSTLLTRACW